MVRDLLEQFSPDGYCRVMEYGKKGNNNKFVKDCEKCYVTLTELGRSNTSR